MKKNKLTMIAALLAAVLIIAGCSPGIPGSKDNPLPGWLANATLSGEITTTITYSVNGATSEPITETSPANYVATSTDISGWKSGLEAAGISYFEKSSDSEYTITAHGINASDLIPTLPDVNLHADETMTLRKISDTEASFSQKVTASGNFNTEIGNVSISYSMTATGTLAIQK